MLTYTTTQKGHQTIPAQRKAAEGVDQTLPRSTAQAKRVQQAAGGGSAPLPQRPNQDTNQRQRGRTKCLYKETGTYPATAIRDYQRPSSDENPPKKEPAPHRCLRQERAKPLTYAFH